MQTQEIRQGNTVQLISGSPVCTVEDVNDRLLSLVWFDFEDREFHTACVCACAVRMIDLTTNPDADVR